MQKALMSPSRRCCSAHAAHRGGAAGWLAVMRSVSRQRLFACNYIIFSEHRDIEHLCTTPAAVLEHSLGAVV